MEREQSEPARSEAGRVTDDTRLEPNEAEVPVKAYDDEVVFMHLTTGVYASIEQLGAVIWQAIEKRYSVREIAALLEKNYEVTLPEALSDVRELASQLLQEGFARPSAALAPTGAVDTPATRTPYQTPQLVIYRDMEDLLALDPPLPEYAEAPWKKT